MNSVNYISFPGLGIGEIPINRVAFTIFGRDVAWYGVIISFGMVLAFLLALKHAKKEGVSTDDLLDITIFTVIFSIIGARFYYVITSLDSYIVEGNFLETLKGMVAIWNGGLAIYGGIIAGAITVLVICRIKKLSFAKICDLIAPSLMLGQIIGRWGNFVNAEAHGTETTLPWRMGIRPAGSEITSYVHPTFLYESLWNLLGLIIILSLYKKKKYNGKVTLMYLAWYGFGRAFIEQLRTDSLYVGSFRISQLVGIVTFIAAGTCLIVFGIKHKNDKPILECASGAGMTGAEKSEAGASEADTDKADADKSESEDAKDTSDSESMRASDTEKDETEAAAKEAAAKEAAAKEAAEKEKAENGTDN